MYDKNNDEFCSVEIFKKYSYFKLKNMNLEDKVAIVTCGASGTGKEIVKCLLQNGIQVCQKRNNLFV